MLLRLAFYRQFGILKVDRFAKPEMHPVSEMNLPQSSIFHYFPTDPVGVGMDRNDPIFNGYKGKFVQMFHVKDYTLKEPIGKFRVVNAGLVTDLMEFHRKNRFFRMTRDYTAALDNPKLLTVINYAAISAIHVYNETPLMMYERWYNRYKTLWATIAEVAGKTENQQYVVLDVPAVQPAQIDLIKYEDDGMSTTLMKRLDKEDKLVVADLWCWLGHHRSKSAISEVSEKDLMKVNVIFNEMGRWTVINLGLLNSWRSREVDEGDLDIESLIKENKGLFTKQAVVDTLRLQRRMLRMFMSFNEETLSLNALDEEGLEKDLEASGMEDIERDAEGAPVFKRQMATAPGKPRLQVAGTPNLSASDDISIDEAEVDEAVLTDEDVERDLERLENLAKENGDGPQLTYEPYVPPHPSLEAGVMGPATELVQRGLLSPAQHRRMEKLANKYKELPNPYGEGKLTDLLVIKPEEVAIPEKHPLAEAVAGVNDESFLSSSLKAMNKNYVDKVLKKDLAKAVMHLQRGGFAVQSYDVTTEETINDHFEVHTIRVQPAIGAASTLRFRLPVVDKDGNFLAGGVRSKLRTQRGDIPIRKIGPGEVALTSYYSKLFVTRAERMVFNLDSWLVNQITARAVNDEDNSVTEVRFGRHFIKEEKLPRHYTILSTAFTGFRSGDFTFQFDYDDQKEHFDPALIERVKKTDLIELTLCGHKANVPIAMDLKNQLFTIKLEGNKVHLSPVGTLFSIIGLDPSKAPVEIAEVNIFAKAIPVGFVLGYIAGLGDLLETIKTPYRRVKTRSHYKMEPDEFDVRFEDDTLIFKRTHLACMIFGGFNRYHRDIKRLSVYAFDKKDIYGSVLANNDISVRSLREMDTMFKMWVDHITEEILVEMKEPTDLFNLMISAVKKLEFDDHPDPMSNLYMRDKGYERFAGLVYSEMVKAMRVYSWKPQTVKSQLGLNPEAVWHTLLGDATVAQVEDSNPIANLQEKEVVVYRGEGGRSTRSMTAKTRGYHPTSLGVISEAGVDKGDVGTVIYTTADPSYASLRGIIRPVEKADGNAGQILSTSTLMAPGLTTDD